MGELMTRFWYDMLSAEDKELLRRLYEEALNKNENTFVFQGAEMDTRYVGYLFEYVDPR